MKSMMRKPLVHLLAALVSFSLVFFVMPGGALAAAGDTGTDGNFGWTELADGTVAVSSYSGPGGAVTIPDTLGGKTVTQIGERAFFCAISMTGITMPSTLKSIGDSAFAGCTWLHSVDIPGSVISIGDGAFSACTFMQTVTLHNGLQSLGVNAFTSCSSLQSIVIPNSVTSIGGGAFMGCTSLESATLPDNPAFTDISQQLFQGCISLDGVVIPDSVTSIGSGAFNAASITTITIPAAVSSIGDAAFTSSKLTAFQVNPSNTHFISLGGVLYNIGKTDLIAYPRMAPGSAYTVPDSVTDISSYAFSSAWNLTSITLPDHLQTIGGSAFMATSIANITIPKSVTTVGNGAFMSCIHLKKVVFLCKNATLGTNLFVMSAGMASDGIYGLSGSTAQTFATANTILFHFLYTVTFESSGGSAVDDAIVAAGDTFAAPADPTMSGYDFSGWYQDSDFSEPWNFSTDTVTADMTLYPKWTPVPTTTPSASPTATPAVTPSPTATLSPTATPELQLSMSPASGEIFTGGRITLTPSIAGGTWSFDSTLLKRSGDTFTGLKAGTARVTYTAGSQSAYVDVSISQADMPQTGQDFSPALWLLAGAAATGAVALALLLMKRRKTRA